MRFDRRKTYPRTNPSSVINALRAIVPRRIGGVIKQPGNSKILTPVNIAIGNIADRAQYLIPAIKMSSGGTSPFFGSYRGKIGGPGQSGPIEEVLARFPNPLSDMEIDAITEFVNGMNDAGMWDLLDSFSHIGMLDEQNCFVNWVGDPNPLNGGNPAVHNPGIGFDFLSSTFSTFITNFFKTDFKNYSLNDGSFGVNVITNTSGDLTDGFVTFAQSVPGTINKAGINGNALSLLTFPIASGNTIIITISPTESIVYVDGVNVVSTVRASDGSVGDNSTELGKKDLVDWYTGTISTFWYASDSGMDHPLVTSLVKTLASSITP